MSKRKLTKEKLSIHLQRKKIDFTNYNQEQLETIFFKRNYYYKFASYKKNFEKNKFGEYSNLSVQQLEKLSILDTLLRYFFLNLTMDIEHYSKTYILELISENNSVQGKNYSNYHSRLNNITSNEYKSLIRKVEKEKLNKIKEYEKNIYSNDKIIKNKNNISIWFLLDTVTFAEYIKFIEFFYEKYHNIISSHDSSRIKELKSYIYIAKDFRNILAHNQVILLNIKN